MPVKNSSEQGQVLVIIVLSLVVLFGFAALAIDGGMIYSDRRHAQNASDAASLAGGSAGALSLENDHVTYGAWNCGNSNVQDALDDAVAASISRAGDNDFSIDEGIDDFHGATANCGSEVHGAWTENFLDVTTHISTTTQTAFAHFIYFGKLQSRVQATTRVHPRAALAFGHAIVALNDDPNCVGNQNGAVFSGNIEVIVEGGGIFSNGCLRGNGNSLNVDVDDGDIVHIGELDTQHPGTFDPAPTSGGGIGLPEFALGYPIPDCSQVSHFASPSTAFRNHASGHIPAGNYSKIKMNGAVTLEGGGLYCLYGDFDSGNNDVSIDTSTGNGVTIYLLSGSFITSGGGEVVLFAPPDDPNPAPAIPGLLVYLAAGNDGLIKLRGNSESVYVGTLYAPEGRIDIAGTADMPPGEIAEFNTQLVAHDVEIGGNAYVNVNFDEDTAYLLPTSLELHR